MFRKISTDEQLLINTIMLNVVDSASIQRVINDAKELSKKYLESKPRKNEGDNTYLHSLRVAVDAAAYAKKVSQPNFYRYDIVVIALLHDLIEDADTDVLKELAIFETMGKNSVLEGIKALTNDTEKIKELGRAKYMNMKFKELSKNNDLMAIKLMDRVDNLNCLDLITETPNSSKKLFKANYLLESLAIYNNLCMGGYSVHNDVYPLYNEFATILMKTPF